MYQIYLGYLKHIACNLYSMYCLNYLFGGFGDKEPDDICYYL